MNDVSLTPTAQLDLDSCAAEPIRIPGAIQPHGALLVVRPKDFVCLNFSANLLQVAGFELKPGDRLSDVAEARQLTAELRRWLDGEHPAFLRTVTVGEFVLQVFGHVTEQGVVLEFEDPPHSEAETLEGLYPRLREFLDDIARAEDLQAIADAAVREVRALTGFNRTLLYSFDEAGDGTVLAEDTDGVLPSYRGLRFPASDIPAQARELYRLNRIRLIASADYEPVPVLPAISPTDGKPLDLSLAALRSVSPIHLEYMRNMGTGSSMSISILVEGRLWGLISGHSREPRQVNPQVRTACDILGQVLSLQVEARERADAAAERLSLKQVETDLLARLALSTSFQRALADNSEIWLELTHAAGAAVITEEGVLSTGDTPEPAEITAIAHQLFQRGDDHFATDSLAQTWPDAAGYAATACGLLAVSISQIHPDYIMWFRPEVIRTVEWGGDPNKPMEPKADRLSPRTSFELWKEQVRLHSLPWRDAEVESARGFRNAIQNLVLKRAEERAELTGRLERINKELESFSYSISHDLRAPFRHIVGYAELLSEREKDLDAKSRHYVQSISEAAVAAGRLVDDLLNFSQMGRASLHLGKIDISKLVSEIRRSLEPDVAGRKIEWRIGELPEAWGDGPMVRQALLNLIQNAVKYTGPRELAVITVEGEDRGESVAYTVSDNGVGFDRTYVGKLFGVFQRLHRAEDFEGTGIGLALAKRIVERHGGTIAADGVLGQGATFTFTLPKRQVALRGETTRG
ncbi:ATP-binding protein [Phenylobacterium deserti]|uniref:histidine kinase n=1 Tax=Phenylobacterium deserti TaxID=1914756 RepID=A0A328ACJ5_9CAUL|nr:ATP-binding protein [Phenylobacterium deserti]RAK52472.1 histidine kinase [Phenylobacterium deserti]